MNILVLAALTDATGNATTAQRIAAHLSAVHHVTVVDANETSLQRLQETVERDRITFAVGVHALLSGPFLAKLGVPYVLVFGGTDLYENTDPRHENQMAGSVVAAKHLVAFSAENRERAEWMWPSAKGRVHVLPQAVDVTEAQSNFSLRQRLSLLASDILVVLPTGLRRVKDPTHVVEAISVWHTIFPRVHLAIVGAVLEPEYAEDALRKIEERFGVHYVPSLTRPQMLASMKEADVILNTSLSEGMSGVLLEAMALEKPVVARRNAGNESLIAHGSTGLLYDSPTELVHWIAALVSSKELRLRISAAASEKVDKAHSPSAEKARYLALIEGQVAVLAPPGPSAISVDDLSGVFPTLEWLNHEPPLREAVRRQVETINASDELLSIKRQLAGLLATAPPSVAIEAIRRSRMETRLGREGARAFYLVLALLQVPAARARHAARGIDLAMSVATLRDLTLWASELHRQTGSVGITLENLEWAQRYLRGELLQIGALQFDLRPFANALRVWRHVNHGALLALSLDGRRLDLNNGELTNEYLSMPSPEHWQLVLEPGTPLLEMFIPRNELVDLKTISDCILRAYDTFSRLTPETRPRCVTGQSWRLDPQLKDSVPETVLDLQRVCQLYPSTWSEARTLRRLFGPDVDRTRLLSLPRDSMNALQQSVADFLIHPGASLRARGGFVLREDIERVSQEL